MALADQAGIPLSEALREGAEQLLKAEIASASPLRTASGRVLSDPDFEALADDAEAVGGDEDFAAELRSVASRIERRFKSGT